MPGIMVPSMHLNGDTREELLRINRAAFDAAMKLIDALHEAAPNARNFYVQGDNASTRAAMQHRGRLLRAEGIKAELEEICSTLMQ